MLDNYIKWVFLFLALADSQFGSGYPVGPTPQTYPQDGGKLADFEENLWERNLLYGVLSTLSVVVVFASLLFGCMWCFSNKHTKTDEGTSSSQQLFTSSAAAQDVVRGSHPPDSGFSELSNNNIAEDNNNGPISLREMQNIANNNAAAYIVSENEERNPRESVVEFEPLPANIRLAADPLERCADWFRDDDLPRNRLQYLREIGRGWFGRVVEGEIEEEGASRNSTVAVKILNQNASLEDKARFLDEAKMYRDVKHENILAFLAKCLQEDPWLLVFELCSMDLQQYLVTNRPKMAILNESGVPLQLMSDVAAALSHLHQRGYLYGPLWSGSVMVREAEDASRTRAVLGRYAAAPDDGAHPPEGTASPAGEVWALGALVWAVCAWGAAPPAPPPLPPPDLPCPYRTHLYQLMQLCWQPSPVARPSAAQLHALLEHLRTARRREPGRADTDRTDFEERWQTLKPNTIPKTDEHVAIVHAPSTSTASHFTGSDRELETLHTTLQDNLSVDMIVSRSSSIMSDRDPLSVRFKSESLTNLHGSLDDVRNIYLTHNENPVLECNQANIGLDDARDTDRDRSDATVDPWLKDIMAGSQDDVSYYKDVSDVIKNLDNILNSEKTSSSESSHQASPSRDNLSLDCKKEHTMQSSMVKSPGITNFQSVLDMGFDDESQKEPCGDDEADRDTIGTLSHSFERHSDTTSQHTLENLTPDTPIKNEDNSIMIESHVDSTEPIKEKVLVCDDVKESINKDSELPKVKVETSDNKLLMLKELCLASISVSVTNVFKNNERLNVSEDCKTSCDNILKETVRTDNQESNTKSSEENENLLLERQSNYSVSPSQVEELISKSDSVEKIEQIEEKDDILEDVILPKLGISTTEQRIKVDDTSVLKSESVTYESKDQKAGTAQDWSSQNSIPKLEEMIDYSKNISITSTVPINTDHALNSATSIMESDFQAVSDHDLKKNSVTLASSSLESEKLICPISEDSVPDELKTNIDLMTPVAQEIILEVEAEKIQDKNEENDIALVDTQPLTILPLMPELVQNFIDREKQNEISNTIENFEFTTANIENLNAQTPVWPSEIVQNIIDEQEDVTQELKNVIKDVSEEQTIAEIKNETTTLKPTDSDILESSKQHSVNSTIYMTLDSDTQVAPLINNTSLERNLNEATDTHLERSEVENANEILKNESTVYLDLPNMIKTTDDFLHSERIISCQTINFEGICASTPLASDSSAENIVAEKSKKQNDGQFLSETKVPDSPGILITKFEEPFPHETGSPLESPTKSHHTDTYDENSSVVLGPFENCTELFKGTKSNVEEILAFSANFSELDLETPSPLRDGNFLNEVPDIAHDDLHSDSVEVNVEVKREVNEPVVDQQTDDTDETDNECGTERHVSPSTPPNSPGNFLVASTSQQKYLVDIDLYPPIEAAVVEPAPRDAFPDIDLNQIDLQITTKLAMAENENNMNIEYAGPLTVEGVTDDMLLVRDDDALPESLLAGNGGSLSDMRQNFCLDEESVQALRNELELKLPLAQVASIEPPCEGEVEGEGEAEGEAWASQLPPPPDELVVSYPGALSPIAEETGLQLTAYENDAHWYPPTRTDSSESYLEPCNNSTDEVTDLPTGTGTGTGTGTATAPGALGPSREHSTFTVHSNQNSIDSATYTIQKDVDSSREMTMSADSLNGSPYKIQEQPKTPSLDHTPYHTKNDEEKEFSCERLSQESPFMLSPTTDTSAPETLENEHATGASTLSRTTLATDAKLSKPSETQCISKATSIDSWCSNDTLYNVEENFDDLASDPEGSPDCDPKDGDHSESQTLTHNDDEKEHSHCSTYIIHDSKSDPCGTFTPDSITANDHNTYTKIKTEPTAASPATKSEVNDSTKTKDLAYGTLNSGLPSYSNCTTEAVSGFEEAWKVQQPELVRRSPIGNDVDLTPPKRVDDSNCSDKSPQLSSEHRVKKMDSVELSCLQDASVEDQSKEISGNDCSPAATNDNSNCHYGNMAPSVTSTPFLEHVADEENIEHVPLQLPRVKLTSPDLISSVPNFQTFVNSAELRPQDLTLSPINEVSGAVQKDNAEVLLESEVCTLSRNSNKDSAPLNAHSTNYSDFESSVRTRPSNVNVSDNSSQLEFRRFENSVRSRPQDLSSLIDASAMLLRNERACSGRVSQPASASVTPAVERSSLLNKSFSESHSVGNIAEPTNYLIAGYIHNEEETEQPHSIIITELPKEMLNKTYDSHTSSLYVNFGFNSQASLVHVDENHDTTAENSKSQPDVNGVKIAEPTTALETAEQIKEIVNSPSKDSIIVLTETSNTQNLTKPLNERTAEDVKCNGDSQNYATVNFINENFEELLESNVDEGYNKDVASNEAGEPLTEELSEKDTEPLPPSSTDLNSEDLSPTVTEVKDSVNSNGVREDKTLTSVTESFLLNEKKFCQFDAYLPLLSDIRFTGPASEVMSTSFTHESRAAAAADALKDWDSDTDSRTSNSSSGEFIWKDGEGRESCVASSTRFEHQRGSDGGGAQRDGGDCGAERSGAGGSLSGNSGSGSGSGSEGDEVEFVPSSWDCRAAPAKSSLRSLEATPESKKRVVFKRQKYHCVYEYPREAADAGADSPAAYLPDFSTYSEWDPSSVEDAELGYGHLFGAPGPLDHYPLRTDFAFTTDYDEDFFISSSSRPFESLGLMTASQFFPGKHLKPALPEPDLADELPPPPPPPVRLPTPALATPTVPALQTRAPSLDFTTPDSGVEDITPGSTSAEEEFKAKKQQPEECWRPVDSGSSSESVSPSSPGGEALGGLRHTRDKLKLDLPPSPHVPSPRHNRVFNFVLDKPKRRLSQDERPPIVMTDETPVAGAPLPLDGDCCDGTDPPEPAPEPTFSTFGKSVAKIEPEQKMILTDDDTQVSGAVKEETASSDGHANMEPVKGEGTVLDSGDEDSGIESSSKATLERNKPAPNVS